MITPLFKRPDPLQGLNRRQRAAREAADTLFLRDHEGMKLTASRESIERDNAIWAGIPDILNRKDFRPYEPGDDVDFVICARINLDHPLYYPDNLFADCLDCGTNLQYRPTVPARPKICVCCAADRVRAEEKK